MYNKAMNTTRTIIHGDGHTDVETYMKDADGVWIWAVTQCGLKQEKQAMTGYNGLNSVKTNLAKAGICKHDGLRFTDPKCTHATAAQIAYTKKLDADYDFMQEHKDQARLCNAIVQDVQPRFDFVFEILDGVETDTLNEHRIIVSRLDNSVDVVDAQRWHDTQDPLARARSIAYQNGQLRSYATYKNTGKAQPLSAEAVDGERLGE